MHHYSIVGFALVTLFALTACGDSTSSDGDPSARGLGSITLDGTRYDFTVEICDLTGETDDEYQTVYGEGEMPDGEAFQVFASRNQVNEMLMHSVSFQTGNVSQGEGTVIEAHRFRLEGTWNDIHGGPDEPLLQISGSMVTAAGTFHVADELDNTMQGSFEATCN